MKPGRAKEHVAERWSTWLGEILGLAAAQRGLSDISPILLNEIAKVIAIDPNEPNSRRRSDVKLWLNPSLAKQGGRYISPEMCFKVGQKLGEVNGVTPKPGGALALLAAGHFGESIAVLYNVLVAGIIESVEVSHIPNEGFVYRSGEQVAESRAAVLYVLRFVANAFTTLAAVDEVAGISQEERSASLRVIGDAPTAALERAWRNSQFAPLPINIEFDPAAADYDGLHGAALVSWAAFGEIIAQNVGRMYAYRETWSAQRKVLARYLELAHESMPPLLVTRVSEDNLERIKPRPNKRVSRGRRSR